MKKLQISARLVKGSIFTFVVIVLLQLLFFSLLSIVLFNYSQSIVGPQQTIDSNLMGQKWMQELPTEENLRDLGIPGTDVAAIESQTKKMEAATIRLYGSIILLYLLFCGLGWMLSYRLALLQQWNAALRSFGKWIVVAFFGLSMFFLLIHSAIILLTTQFFTPNASQNYAFMIPLSVAAILVYFIPVSLAIAGVAPLKEIMQRTIHIGIRKCLFLFSFYGAFTLIIGMLVIGMLKMTTVSFVLSLILGLLILISIAFSRILLINKLEEKN